MELFVKDKTICFKQILFPRIQNKYTSCFPEYNPTLCPEQWVPQGLHVHRRHVGIQFLSSLYPNQTYSLPGQKIISLHGALGWRSTRW